MAPRQVLVWVIGVLLLLGAITVGIEVRKQTAVRSIKQAQQQYDRALREFDQREWEPANLNEMSWTSQYNYLKTRVYPKKEAKLDEAGAALQTMERLSGRAWNRELQKGLKRYRETAGELLAVYWKLWANEKDIDRAFYTGNREARQRLALARQELLEKRDSLQEEAARRWQAINVSRHSRHGNGSLACAEVQG